MSPSSEALLDSNLPLASGPEAERGGRRRARLLQFTALPGDGVGMHLRRLVPRLSRDKYDVRVLCPENGPLAGQLTNLGVAVDSIAVNAGMDLAGDLRALPRLAAYFRAHQFDLVHCHSTKAGLLGRVVGRWCRIDHLVYTPHAYRFLRYEPYSAWWLTYLGLERLVGRSGSATISIGEGEGALTERYGLASVGRRFVVNNGIEELGASHRAPGIRARLGLPENRPLVVTVGRLCFQKDPLRFVEIAAIVAAADPSPVFVMVGEGELHAEVLRRAAERGIGERVYLVGETKEVASLLAEAAVFVMTSRYEGLSYAAIEAAMCGSPLVVSDVPGLAEVVRDGSSGYVVPRGNTGQFAARVGELLARPDLRRRMGVAGQRYARVAYNIEQMVCGTEAVYDELLG